MNSNIQIQAYIRAIYKFHICRIIYISNTSHISNMAIISKTISKYNTPAMPKE